MRTIEVGWCEEKKRYVASYNKWPYLSIDADTKDEAVKLLKEAIKYYDETIDYRKD